MNTTHTPPHTVIETSVIGDKLYGGTSNPYYAKPEQRRVHIEVRANDKGQHIGTVGTRDRALPIGTSPVLPDRAAAEAWVAEVSEYAQRTLTAQIGNDRHPEGLFLLHRSSFCGDCGGVDTLKLSQEAWIDRVTCTQCGDESIISIGD